MKRTNTRDYGAVRASRLSLLQFLIFFGGLLLASAMQSGLVAGMHLWNPSTVVQTVLPIVYWSLVSLGLTFLTRHMIRTTFEAPVKSLAAATRKVADGYFSVYVPPLHTSDRFDYLDVMILDFNKMVAELGSIETLKTDFFSNVSHEIKTPLAVIQNTAQLLRDERLAPAQRQEHVETIEKYARRLTDLITNILKLNKLEKQTIQPKPEPYDLCAQLAECALLFEQRWEDKGLELEADLEDACTVEADESLMELV